MHTLSRTVARAEGPAGSVEVESPPAGGAVFRMLLPLPLG